MYIYTYYPLYISCIIRCIIHHPSSIPCSHRETHSGGDGTDEGREDAHGQEDDPNRKEPGGLAVDRELLR